jgi:hypothetical protein
MAEFFKHAESGREERICAERALEVHKAECGYEGDDKIQVWHLILTLATYSDAHGFFRDQVFGPRQSGGPRVHRVICGVRALCAARGFDFEALYGEVKDHMASEPPTTPTI